MVSQAQSELFTNSNSSASARRMAQANLEQSQAVVGGLLATLLAQIRPPLIVSRLEGDAVFCYAPDGSFLQGQTMLEVIDSLYYSFRQAMELEDQNTDCDCQAWQDYYVDWQPFDYATAEYALPLGGTGRLTMSLTPIPSGTRVSVRAERPSGPGLRGLPVRVLSYWNKRRLEGAWRARLQSLQALVTADQAARSLAAPYLELADQ